MRIYTDSSALIKRAIDEPESDAIEAALSRWDEAEDTFYASTLAWIEVNRALRTRIDHHDLGLLGEVADAALSGIAECPITDEVASLARRIVPPVLRSLDAIHLATATLIDADVIVAYDARLLTAARELGFRVASPE